MTTVAELLESLPAGEADLARDARHLLAHLLRAKSPLALRPETAVPVETERSFEALCVQLLRGSPVQYLIGEWDFFGRTFLVDDRALIPRPESEHLVEEALRESADPRRIVDLGCGSGILAVTLALELPQALVLGVDRSPGALALSRHNARRLGVLARTSFVASDWLAAVGGANFDLAVANPPYVPEGDRSSLPSNVREFEPAEALFAAGDGLAEIRRLLDGLPPHLEPGSPFLFEFGFGQGTAVAEEIGRRREWTLERLVDDLAGIPRVAVARRSRAAAPLRRRSRSADAGA